MVTSDSPSPPAEAHSSNEGQSFVGQLVKSVFEPGANQAAVLAMNVSFFLLLLTLAALAFLTSWNKHVLLLLGVTALLWASMLWFVMELTKVQTRPDNMPLMDGSTPEGSNTQPSETKKDQ
ncbi:ER protein Pkr1-domain-containing protein [Papiliotrema laurentii]|uniref:ER protein Pkr1-domain-containing protein n=1 Tax=Papiliotrema laurentii TaxID=5418 RepID=A0AAD9CX36_PAPLA|nr:ER protein Pkr1-domain-containing protein [Papiliotrema laurentii]